jgi:ubiquinone/menaquinone biosynthesis C-methylase UbiE
MGKGSKQEIYNRLVSKGVFPHQMAFTLLIPARNLFLSPGQLISRLQLRKDSHVLEVGPGPGYFSTHIAKAVTHGKLVLADIQQEMLDKAKKRISGKKLTNVEFYLCDGNNFLLPDEAFDVIFLVTVIGEIENKNTYVKEFHRLLKAGGILSISELKGDPDKLSVNEIKELLADSGLVFDHLYGNRNNFTINFKKNEQ